MGGYTKQSVSNCWRVTHNCYNKGAFVLHYYSSLTYLLVWNGNDMVERNVIVKYHRFNRIGGGPQYKGLHLEDLQQVPNNHHVGDRLCEDLQPFENFEQQGL
jgi:hypothetical protein